MWQDARFSGGEADAIALTSSADGGRTWSEPVKVNATPTDIPAPAQQAFTARVGVAADGTVAVDYSDFRHTASEDARTGLPTGRWLVRCDPGADGDCADEAGFGGEVALTEPFDLRAAPKLSSLGPPGFLLGDYMGLVHAGADAVAVWAQPFDREPATVLARRVHR